MASPPYRSPGLSPPTPYNASLPNPRKRPPMPMPMPAKRRKASTYSVGSFSHPLRQTSFPPDEGADNGARSPSVESDVTAFTGGRSVVASTAGGKIRKARRFKGIEERSIKSGRSGVRSKIDDGGTKADGLDEEDEEEVEDDADGDTQATSLFIDEGARLDQARDMGNFAVLLEAMDPDQQHRHEIYMRIKFKPERLKKIVNAVLSQSVPPGVLQAINGYVKVWVGMLIERALDVQRQEAEALRSLASPNPLTRATGATTGISNDEWLGPLLPDHLREAHRRYKKDGECGDVGAEGVSTGLGLTGSVAAKLNGKRLFR